MRKIAVVDDEIRQCRGLKNILIRQYENTEVEAFTDAKAALSYIQKEKIKIIITDICMPGMDGLTMTEHIKGMDIGAKVILLTGFAEFEYARKAISLGAFDYLLKPLNPDKLREILERADEEINQEEILSRQHEKLQQQLEMTLPVYIEKLLNQWVYGWASLQEREEVEKIISAGDGGFIIVTKLPGLMKNLASMSQEETEDIRNQIIWWMRERIAKPWHSLSFFSNVLQDTLITIVTSRNEISEAASKSIISSVKGSKCAPVIRLERFDGTMQMTYVMGIGLIYQNLNSHIEECYRSAVTVLQYSFYFPDVHFLQADDILAHRVGQISVSLAEEEFIREALKEGDGEKAAEVFRAIMERCLVNGYPDPMQLKGCMENMLNHITKSLKWEKGFKYEGTEVDHIEMFEKQVTDYLMVLAAENGGGKYEKNTELAKKYMNWMDQHYGENISLNDIADFLNLTPAYCSAMIKDVTGSTFSKKLTEIRIAKAKQMLLETGLHIYEIAQKTGFSDVKYFNRVFKKETGINPVQYREELHKIGERKHV